MCGIAGFFEQGSAEKPQSLNRMLEAVRARGPDGSGQWNDPGAQLWLGHARLAIQDVSPSGAQPMLSASGRFVITYNGEIYNAPALRAELVSAGAVFKSSGDTEVLLEAIAHWGITKTLPKLNGMFAFAVWDREERSLHLVRDRIGIKPLYYGWQTGRFLFGSTLSTISAHPSCLAELDTDILRLFVARSYIPAPYSIYRKIFKLPPGCLLTIPEANRFEMPGEFSAFPTSQVTGVGPCRYWNASEVVRRGIESRETYEELLAVDQLDALLQDAVKLRLLSDVPLGAFLSGGIDSSLVVALMQSISSSPVKTFSIGFTDSSYDEAPYARAVANHLQTDHTELYVNEKDCLNVVSELSGVYGEPFADPSCVPTYLLSQLTRQSVTVSLSGDGGDELFAGYGRYVWAPKAWNALSCVPAIVRRAGGATLRTLPATAWNRLFRLLRPLLPHSFSFHDAGDKLFHLLNVAGAESFERFYFDLLCQWEFSVSPCVLADSESQPPIPVGNGQKPIDYMMSSELTDYLPDDLLVKLDRASMGVSLEARVPLLDHRVVEFAWGLPLECKLVPGALKRVLRTVLDRYVPRELIDRPKQGFSVPIGDWLRGPLVDWAEGLLAPDLLARQGYLNVEVIRTAWDDHRLGRRNRTRQLWNVLMFQSWLEHERH